MYTLPVDRPRVLGIESEYGFHPVPLPYRLNASQVNEIMPDYLHPTTRGFCEYGRIYPDQGTVLEVCTPESISLRGLLASHFAGESLAQQIINKACGPNVNAQKRSLDSAGRSHGEHDNFLVGSGFDESDQVALLPFLASRTVLTGPGTVHYKKGKKARWQYATDARLLVTDGSEPIKAGSTQEYKKPYMKTLDAGIPTDSTYDTRRLQVVCASQNMYAFPIAVRTFATSAIMRLQEQGKYPRGIRFANLEDVTTRMPRDVELKERYRLADGRRYKAIDVLTTLFEKAVKLDLPKEERQIVELSSTIVSDIAGGHIDRWSGYIEWWDKLQLLQRQAETLGFQFPSVTSAELDIKWHELRSDMEPIAVRLRRMGKVAMMPSPEDIQAAMRMPLDATRGLLRAEAIRSAAQEYLTMEASTTWISWKSPLDETPTKCDDPWAYDAYGGGHKS